MLLAVTNTSAAAEIRHMLGSIRVAIARNKLKIFCKIAPN